MTDLNNPKMQGIQHPIISIGTQFTVKMISNFKTISADEVDEACKRSYDQCIIHIKMQLVDKSKRNQLFVTVFASYTNRPLLLTDGIAHPTEIKPEEVKHFKYAITNPKKIMVTLKYQYY